METFKLSLEQDKDIPHFKRLNYEKVQVPISLILTKGIHPWQGAHIHRSLEEKFVEILNSKEMKIAELDKFSYCSDISVNTPYYCYYSSSPFEETLKDIKEQVYFVKELSYVELIKTAKEQLLKKWSHQVAYDLLKRVYYNFDDMRRVLKMKDKNIKLSSYSDIEKYDLSKILILEDFEGEDKIIISEGLPSTNFRSEQFIKKVTDENGHLRLVESINDFKIMASNDKKYFNTSILYNCYRNKDQIKFVPELSKEIDKRQLAKTIATQWRIDNGRYCFTTDIEHLSQMITQENYEITFPNLEYMHPQKSSNSEAQIQETRVNINVVGSIITVDHSVESIKRVLQNHGISMTGRKEELLEKLAQLSTKLYEESEPELNQYFKKHKFIHYKNSYGNHGQTFPILENLDLKNIILTMYIIKHLRANTILESQHKNNTYTTLKLSQALLKKEVTLNGAFLKVE